MHFLTLVIRIGNGLYPWSCGYHYLWPDISIPTLLQNNIKILFLGFAVTNYKLPSLSIAPSITQVTGEAKLSLSHKMSSGRVYIDPKNIMCCIDDLSVAPVKASSPCWCYMWWDCCVGKMGCETTGCGFVLTVWLGLFRSHRSNLWD